MTIDTSLKTMDNPFDPPRVALKPKMADQVEKRKEIKVSYSQTRQVRINEKTLAENRIVSSLKSEEIVAAYKILRTRVLQKLKANKWNSFAVTSARQGQGTTLSAINTAISLAQEHTHSVLLVDFNLRRPNVCKALGITPEFGVEDYLFNQVPLDQILLNPGMEKLVILPCKSAIEDASELMSTPRVTELVEELKSRYSDRVVIFDLPPVLEGDEVISFCPFVDALLLVIKENETRKEDIAMMADLLKGIPVLGTVLNQASL